MVADLRLSRLLLLDDHRWPWLVLVPRIAGVEEIHHLDHESQLILTEEISRVSEILKSVTSCDKINIGALGNIVRQLHIHVIARNEGDANWPGPVWGYGQRQPYIEQKEDILINTIKANLVKDI